MNLSGEILQQVSTGDYISPILSPTGEWLVGVVWSGEQYYNSAEFQDLEVIAIDGTQEPIRLTERGGASGFEAAWSPDGTSLAYSDYDEEGIAQPYRSTPDGSDKRRLTQFTTQGLKIGVIKWSPDETSGVLVAEV